MSENLNIKLLKWLKWEFWPFWFFYIPLYFKYFYLSAKAKSLGFFTAANPLMIYGGFTDYSKFSVLEKIDPYYLPSTSFLKEASAEIVLQIMEKKELCFPIILKPDIGERGFGVERINNTSALEKYFTDKENIGDLILQEYIDYPIELGVMYSRKASESKGMITSVVMKKFLSIKGDGKNNLKTLFINDERAKFYLTDLLELYKNELDAIPENDLEKEVLVIGNHCRGTMFLDANYLINDTLHDVFDKISLPISGYHFGRFDLRVSTLEELYKGENIKIMELNGAASEPAHIYDPNMSLLKAYKHLFAHWQRLFEISIENHQNGTPYTSVFEVIKAINKRGEIKNKVNNKHK